MSTTDSDTLYPCVEITLKPANDRASFSAELDGAVIVESSEQPMCDAARVLHHRGFPDHASLIFRHAGADHESMRGPLGVWRKLRVREDRNGPRYVKWEPFPSRRVTARGDEKALKALCGPRGLKRAQRGTRRRQTANSPELNDEGLNRKPRSPRRREARRKNRTRWRRSQ
jgi:hypothetical protein